MKSVGICVGASRISLVVVEKILNGDHPCSFKLIRSDSQVHDGNITHVLREMLKQNQVHEVQYMAVTGRKFRQSIDVPSLAEAEAMEIAYSHLKHKYPDCDGIASVGGENFMVYQLSKNGQIVNVVTGTKCASGTGEFFLQQIKRMNLNIEEALAIVEIHAPYSLAGRCSVFCKSDCTHALNKGAGKGKVVAGLCKMMAVKVIELIKKCPCKSLLFVGGVAKNQVMMGYVQEESGQDREIKIADEAMYFEAFGAAIWAFDHGAKNMDGSVAFDVLLQQQANKSAFTFMPALAEFADKVIFKSMTKDTAQDGDLCIIGLDVGSTTTKGVVLREADNAILGTIYLRTNGDPVKASRECYQALADCVGDRIIIEGVGVTGSGRQIAGLHADTEGIINEISAHATAAVYFDPEVDTIFEIGGQDAKYTYITNMVPTDYAMNEACSAGTGSFLEESAKESMGIDTMDIAEIAVNSKKPPNFNDQCAAFIGSDIKTAIQEGISREDIVTGLVYSICQNYVNRVKGNRIVGNKIFMQGGVCYNRAVPMAMAALIGKEIVVPPEPGLMGAFGVALELKNKIKVGLVKPKQFFLTELAAREVNYGKPFICAGGQDKCDRKCNINMIEIENSKYPFGGACNKYVNMRKKNNFAPEGLDLVRVREELVFATDDKEKEVQIGAATIGIIKSLLVNSLYPLYYNFFSALGMQVVLGENVDEDGRDRRGAAFCYPVELSHAFMGDLLKKNVDYIFLPNVSGIHVEQGIETSVTCPLVQGEPYYLGTAFNELEKIKVLSPILDFSQGYDSMTKEFVEMGNTLGFSRNACMKAYQIGIDKQKECFDKMKTIGRQVLRELESHPEKTAIVLFGRPYNALTRDVNIGIPNKFASREKIIIPWDFLDFAPEEPFPRMFWSIGQMMMKAAQLVEKHPQLFATYITNFSCGPDSFLLSYFRDIMGQKPSLTLELDSHTADAGVDTRIEAFLDVVAGYIELRKQIAATQTPDLSGGMRSKFVDGRFYVVDASGTQYDLRDENVMVRIPSMGDNASRLLAATMRKIGINASGLLPPTEVDLAMGRSKSTCKECLPFTLVAGSILNDVAQQDPKKILVYFYADSSGPCRFGQYHVQMQNLLRKNMIKNVAVLPLTSDNGYAGMGTAFQLRAWQSFVIAEVLDDIYGALLVLARDKVPALTTYHASISKIEAAVAEKSWGELKQVLRQEAMKLAAIPRKGALKSTKKVAILGEIFVRTDSLSRQHLVERLAEKGIIAKVASIAEFIYYCDYLLQNGIYHVKSSRMDKILSTMKGYFKQHYERQIKNIFHNTCLYDGKMVDIEELVNNAQQFIDPQFTAGDTVLTVGAALTDIIDEVAGIISIGPFGCMPCRISEAILSETINNEKNQVSKDKDVVAAVMAEFPALPFLSIESDGSSFPQIIEAKLELFCLQVDRVHKTIIKKKQEDKKNA